MLTDSVADIAIRRRSSDAQSGAETLHPRRLPHSSHQPARPVMADSLFIQTHLEYADATSYYLREASPTVTERLCSGRISYRVHSGRSRSVAGCRGARHSSPLLCSALSIRAYYRLRCRAAVVTVFALCTAAANPYWKHESPNDGAKRTCWKSSTNAHANSPKCWRAQLLSLDAIAVLRDLCALRSRVCSQPVAPTVELRRFFQRRATSFGVSDC